MYLCGIDIGTTGCKATVYDENGGYQDQAYCTYPVSRHLGAHEVLAQHIWESVQTVLKKVFGAYREIAAIGVTSFGESCVLMDDLDQPVFPIVLYTDPRGREECGELTEALGKEVIEDISGLYPHSMYSLPKIMWVKKHEPERYRRVKHIFMVEDYIIYMLTGNTVIDYSLAARSMAFDIRRLSWSDLLLETAGVDKSLFSRPVQSGTDAGCIRSGLQRELGAAGNVRVVPVGHDQVAAAVGAGVFDAGCAVDGAGTVECITPVYDGIPKGRGMYEGRYAVVPYVTPGKYVTYAFSFTGGALISWYIENLAKWEKELSEKQGTTVYQVLERKMREGPTGILVLPHFAGAATPYMDEGSRGAILGLTIEHTAGDLYRAMMEGVVYEMMINLEHLEKAGIRPQKLRATGGGASSQVWMQMKADMLDMPVVSLGNSQAGAAGCAMMAGLAAGVFPDLSTAAGIMVKEKKTYLPEKEKHLAYQELYEKYRQLYQAVRPLMS